MSTTPFSIIKKGNIPDSEYEIEGEITADALKEFRAPALKSLSEGVKMDGFRPGHVPEKAIIDRFGEEIIAEESGKLALQKYYEQILIDAVGSDGVLMPIGSPRISITKVGKDQPFGFKIVTALVPQFELPNYKAEAKKVASEDIKVEVTDKELEDSIKELQQQIAHSDFHKNNPTSHPVDDHQAHDHDNLPLPEVNEDFIKNFGDFKTIEDFRAKIKSSLENEKVRREKDKQRIKIMDAILEKTTVSIPQIMIDSETNKMMREMTSSVNQMGMDVTTYLKHINKTEDDLKKEWKSEAEKRAKVELMLSKIALAEKISVPADELKKEVDALLAYYKDIDPIRASSYLEISLLNEKVWQFLESVK